MIRRLCPYFTNKIQFYHSNFIKNNCFIFINLLASVNASQFLYLSAAVRLDI